MATGEAPDEWARWLRKMTKRPGWSVVRLAREAGLNRSTIQEWMRSGSKGLTVASVSAVAKGLDVDLLTALRAAAGVPEDAQDPQVVDILVSGLPPEIQQSLIEMVLDQRRALSRAIEIAKGPGSEAVG